MPITATSLAQIQNGSYYLSNSGGIKKAGFWQWFKCATGLGDGREKVQRLVDRIKDDLLANAGIENDDALTSALNDLDTTHSISSSDLRRIATDFKQTHAVAIAKTDAFHVAEAVVDEVVAGWTQDNSIAANEETVKYAKQIALYAARPAIDKAFEYGEDTARLVRNIKKYMDNAKNALGTAAMMANRVNLGYPSTQGQLYLSDRNIRPSLKFSGFALDELHFRAILSCLFDKDGKIRTYDFCRKISQLREEKLQKFRNVFLDAPLAKPGKTNPLEEFLAATADVETAMTAKLDQAKASALADGYTGAEVAKMSTVANFYAEAAGCTELEAFKEVSTPGTKANRLLNYGGRFTENAQNFRDGLRLLDTFANWFNGVTDGLKAIGFLGKRQEGMNKTMLNADTDIFSKSNNLRSVEKFVFEYLAHDTAADLTETDGERMFGMDRNPVAHFFGRGINSSCTQTVAQIPPEKRALFYKAVNLFFPLAGTAAEANTPIRDRHAIAPADGILVVVRLLRHFDQVAEMETNGTLTLANLARLCFPELPKDSACTDADVRVLIDGFGKKLDKGFEAGKVTAEQFTTVQTMMQETGCTFDEALAATSGGKRPAPPKYMATGTLQLSAFDGTTAAGRQQLTTDLVRPMNYGYLNSKKGLLAADDVAFKFTFGEEAPIATNSTEQGMANIQTVIGKIEGFCGKAHPAQASSVMMMVSQPALSILRGGLAPYGIDSNEHSAVNFTLTKNAETGDVTIRYSSPEKLPFSFEWTATVKTDGYVTTTPFKFTKRSDFHADKE